LSFAVPFQLHSFKMTTATQTVHAMEFNRVTSVEKLFGQRSLSFERRLEENRGSLRFGISEESGTSISRQSGMAAPRQDPYTSWASENRPMTTAQATTKSRVIQDHAGGMGSRAFSTSRIGQPTALAKTYQEENTTRMYSTPEKRPISSPQFTRVAYHSPKPDSPTTSPKTPRIIAKGCGDRTSHIDCLPLSVSYSVVPLPGTQTGRWEFSTL